MSSLRTSTADELAEVLRKHASYLRGDGGGVRADLRWADLSSANLSHADLRSANLSHANLRLADLSYADLGHADLSYADLRLADLSYADLGHADLSYADLRRANLAGTGSCFAKLGEYEVWVLPTHTRIGCQYLPNEDWIGLTSDSADSMAEGARDWWEMYRDTVLSLIRVAERQRLSTDSKEKVS